ncbi:hypothetical protein KC678_04430, partial [Candidatus Dojkabacteria bacterium]|nr:hypothetical protein [Candidatus Dojkabacteria bacterium]
MYQKGNKKTHLQQGALFRRQDFASVLPRLELLSLKDQKLRWIILSTLLLLLFLLVNRGAIYRILNIEAGTRTVNFSGKIVNKADGTNLVTGTPSCVAAGADTCDFRVRIYDAASAGNLLFEEEHTDIEIGDTDGVFTLDINSICNSAASGSSDWGTTACVSNGGVDFSSANVFVELAFDPTGAGSYTEVFARKQLSNTGSAFYAERAGNLDTGFTSGSIVFEGSSGIAEDNSNLYWDDSSNFLGVGVNDPGYEIDVDGGIFLRSQGIDNKSGQISFQATTTAAGDRIGYIRQDGTDGINSQLQIGTSGYIGFVLDSNTVSILHNNGLTIGTTTVGSNTLSLYQSTNNEALLIQAPNITSKPAFSLQNLPASTDVNTGKAFEIKVTGEGFGRGQFYSDGGYGIGGGSATRDIFISRAAANRLIVSSNKSTGAADLTVTRGIRAGSSAAPFAYLDAEAGTTTYPSLRIRSGVATTSPNAGEIYSDGTDLFFYNGSGWDDLTATGTSYWTQSGSDIYYDTGKVTVGTTSSRSLLNVEAGTPTYPSILTDNDVLFADSGNIIMTMIAGTTSSSIINFGDSGDEDIGKITYSHVANSLTFTTNAAGRLAINSSGGVTVYGLAGGGSQCLQVDNTGLIGVTGSACGSGSSLFTDGGATTYLTATGDNLAIGSSSTATNEKLLVYSTDADVKLKIASSTVGYPGFILEDSTIAWRFTKNSNDFVIKTSAVAQGIFKINKSSPDYALVIDVDGDVGIGTDSALAKLHVVGGARITDLSGGGTQCVQVDNNGDLSGSGAGCGGGSSLFTDGGATTYLTATGDNLAIGTSSAESKATILSSGLDAADDSALGQYGLTINDQTNTAGLEVGIGFRISSSLGSTDRPGAAITHERTGSSSIGTLNFKTASVANTITTRMTIDEDGDVIITKLAGGGTQCLQVDNTGLISGTAASCGGGASLWTDGGATTYLTATGDNVGIGTTSAQAKIHAQT